MNKKAIMVKFLVTVILALLIFTPACYFTSKLFRLSSQAASNFNDFVGVIESVAHNGDGAKSSFLLILDDDTSIVKFDKDGKNVYLQYPTDAVEFDSRAGFGKVVQSFGGPDSVLYLDECHGNGCNRYSVFYEYPKDKCKIDNAQKDCIMLCRQVEFIDTFIREDSIVDNYGERITTQVFNRELFCKQSVIIPLDDGVDVESFYKFRSGTDPRRILTKLENKGGEVIVTFE
ncbi:hypothetical protein COV17_01410 [Candidatus Woesearchaeota archaeon CG10_big_fil_rev_8_21_14_0_10_36_11]|nr:MAG: hypothetical protein COV17_01410 [Candidatus Woesearchaeota archaeon CG10_big_fil_rev_8_21_14_0_10_36_11]